MRKYLVAFLTRLAALLEFFISLMLAIGIILLCARLAGALIHTPNLDVYSNYEDLLETCFNLIIGVELIRMMYHHTPDTIFEVLVFAIARQIIIYHDSSISSLVGVCAIAILFATRKFLFYEFDIADKNIFRASTKIYIVNKVMRLSLPYKQNETLADILTEQLAKENVEIGVGACTYFHECGLRVAKMHNGKISRIEVIHAIH